jgi:hypothetical protein
MGFLCLDAIEHLRPEWTTSTIIMRETEPRWIAGREYNFRTGLPGVL